MSYKIRSGVLVFEKSFLCGSKERDRTILVERNINKLREYLKRHTRNRAVSGSAEAVESR